MYALIGVALAFVAGRKPTIGENGEGLKPYTVKLFESQIAWLKAQPNGSDSLRKLLTRAMRRAKDSKSAQAVASGATKSHR